MFILMNEIYNLFCFLIILVICFEFGIGIYFVMFVFFFFVVLEFIVDDVRFGIFLFLFICSIESLNVSCSVWWFLGIWFVFIFENMLVGILVVVWLIMLSMWIIWFYKYFLLYGWIFVCFSLKCVFFELVFFSIK